MLFTVWAFVFDDIIDTNEEDLAHDFEKACLHREQSLAYVRCCMKLCPAGETEPVCPDPVGQIFKDFADMYCEEFDEGR